MKKRIYEWLKRYYLSELISYTLAIGWSWLVFKITHNYYISWLTLILWDYIWYYATIFIKEMKDTIKIKKIYNFKLFIIDIRNLWFEFWLPQALEILIIYPALVFYILPLFNNYTIWAFIAMTWAVIIFYLQTILLYEIRKKLFPKK